MRIRHYFSGRGCVIPSSSMRPFSSPAIKGCHVCDGIQTDINTCEYKILLKTIFKKNDAKKETWFKSIGLHCEHQQRRTKNETWFDVNQGRASPPRLLYQRVLPKAPPTRLLAGNQAWFSDIFIWIPVHGHMVMWHIWPYGDILWPYMAIW